MTKVEKSAEVTNRSQKFADGSVPAYSVYSDVERRQIISILEDATPSSGLPFTVTQRADKINDPSSIKDYQAEVDELGLTVAAYVAQNIEYAARHALNAFSEVEGKGARTRRRKAGRLARELKELIDSDSILQNYIVAIVQQNGIQSLIEADQISNILNSIAKAAAEQVTFPHFPPTPCDAFTLKRYLARSILWEYYLLTGKAGPYSWGERREPHGKVIDLMICCLNPVLARIDEPALVANAAATLVRSVREQVADFMQS